MTDRERRIRRRLRDDFPHYADRCLKIQPGDAGTVPLRLKPAQALTYQRMQQQLQDTGKIRAIILKARKEGISTMIGGMFFHWVTHRRGTRAFVMTHHSESTHQLFSMVRRFYENLPALVRPHAARDSVRELYFDRMDSSYGVGTAGGKEVGRGSTPHLLHASEFGFWANAAMHQAGIMQAVSDLPGTVVAVESTANGVGTEFHGMWQDAESGKSEYDPIFIPWFMDPAYQRSTEDFEPTAEELELAGHFGLSLEQLAWRRNKIASLRSLSRFMQEYPAIPSEAFRASTEDPLIVGDLVLAARKRVVEAYGDVWAGIDPARQGNDRTALVIRQGPKQLFQKTYKIADSMALIGAMGPTLKKFDPKRTFVDIGGLGGPIYDRMKELKFRVTQVNFGESALDKKRYVDMRSQMWDEMGEWLKEADILDDDELHSDLTGPSYSFDSNGRLKLEKKEDMKKRRVRSPDLGDALALSVIGPLILSARRVRVISY